MANGAYAYVTAIDHCNNNGTMAAGTIFLPDANNLYQNSGASIFERKDHQNR
jgi:hypothetical protein